MTRLARISLSTLLFAGCDNSDSERSEYCFEQKTAGESILVDGTCDCGTIDVGEFCFDDVPAAEASPGCFFRLEDDRVATFGNNWIVAPIGWESCTVTGAPPSCACCRNYTVGCQPGLMPGG